MVGLKPSYKLQFSSKVNLNFDLKPPIQANSASPSVQGLV